MATVIDGNLYPINFRLHDNRYVNSPKAVFNGGGVLRSDTLALGEPAFDPATRKLMIGFGGPRAYNVMASDGIGNLVIDYVPLTDEHNNRITTNSLFDHGLRVMTISYLSVKFRNALTIVTPAGVDRVRVGHGHMRAAVSTMMNIQSMLRALIVDDLTNTDVASLFVPPAGINLVDSLHNFTSIYGPLSNMLDKSEDLHAVTLKTVLANVSIAHDTLEAPDTTDTMDVVSASIATATADTCYVSKLAAVTQNTVYCGSVILKKGTSPSSSLVVKFTGGAAPVHFVRVTIDWTTLAVVVTGSDSKWHGGMLDLGNGFYRLWGSGPSQNHTSLAVSGYVRDQSTTHVLNENVGMWGFMAHRGRTLEAYIRSV